MSMTRVPGENLVEDIRFILDGRLDLVVDVGCHQGGTPQRFLDAFPDCHVWGFEPEEMNFAAAQKALASYGDRVRLFSDAVSDRPGSIVFHVNSHHGTHSILEIGEQRYWASHVAPVAERVVASVRLDDVFLDAGEQPIDLLHMDIQGGELKALLGVERLMAERRIRLIYAEVSMFPLYRDQPLFWDLGQFLSSRGFRLYSLYDRYYHDNNQRALSWADALFVCDELVQVPEHRPAPVEMHQASPEPIIEPAPAPDPREASMLPRWMHIVRNEARRLRSILPG